jgi:hypothetical protein
MGWKLVYEEPLHHRVTGWRDMLLLHITKLFLPNEGNLERDGHDIKQETIISGN